MIRYKKRIGAFDLTLGILFVLCIFLFLWGECTAVQAWAEKQSESNAGTGAVLALFVYGIYLGISLIALGIPTLASGIVVLSVKKPSVVKAFVIVGIVLKMLASGVLIFYVAVSISCYPEGIFWKIVYIAIITTCVATSILDIIALSRSGKGAKNVSPSVSEDISETVQTTE